MASGQTQLAVMVVLVVWIMIMVVVVLRRCCRYRGGNRGGCCGGIVTAVAEGPTTQLLDPGLGGLRILEDVVTHAAGVVGMR